MTRNITDPNYSLMSAKDFFGGTDYIRIVILIYIFLSFVLNFIDFFVVGKTIFRKRSVSFGLIITCAILLVNFIHTFAYCFEWVIKKGIVTYKISNENKEEYQVGGLLTGNPSHFFSCIAQAFILIASSLSQDCIINIFFYMITTEKGKIKKKYIILLLIASAIFPIFFTSIYYFTDNLGLNDKFCYVSKFRFKIQSNQSTNKAEVSYQYNNLFEELVIVIYSVRVINFGFSIYFLIKIIRYIRLLKKNKIYIFKSILIPLIQLFTVLIGVIYRIITICDPKKSEELSWIYLALNTSDGILFPLIFLFQNDIYRNFKRYLSGEQLEMDEPLIEDKTDEDEDEED